MISSFDTTTSLKKIHRLGFVLFGGFCLVAVYFWILRLNTTLVVAAPIAPPEGYPKLSLSTKVVTPTLTHTGGTTLTYVIEIRNTGAYTAFNSLWMDTIPPSTTYNNDVQSSSGLAPVFTDNKLEWVGDVGFDSTVEISFSVYVTTSFSGSLLNTAVISHPLITKPVSVTAETMVTDFPILAIHKQSEPDFPGASKFLTYTLTVSNVGQPATNLPITVTDYVPINTSVDSVGEDGITDGSVVTWTRSVSLDYGSSTSFSFAVNVGDVPSGTVLTNQDYKVSNPLSGASSGEVHTTTVIDPIFFLWKDVDPDPPGSNRDMTYRLYLLNKGSLATSLVITDRIPTGVAYQSGGTLLPGNIVQWSLPSLDTGENAQFDFTVYISDVADVDIGNRDYVVCSAEGICSAGQVITSVVHGPTFEVKAYLDPIAKKPGGGGGPVTPTLTLRNLGPGNALDARVTLLFDRISVSAKDLYADPPIGTPPQFPSGPDCGDKCKSYVWVGSLAVGDIVTFTTSEGQSTIGGEEGTFYSATIIVSDTLSNITTDPISTTATGKITHYANLIPEKSAPPVIGRGQVLTYTIGVWNSGLSTDEPPSPVLTETLPMNVTFANISDGGTSQEINGRTVISWTLPAMGPGDWIYRSFSVVVDNDLISGTAIVNESYRTLWYESEVGSVFSITGQPITTTVIEAGLIDSYKSVTPKITLPGSGKVLTFNLNIVNSSAIPLTGVEVYDILPWEHSTYRRDAAASSGSVISDIVSILWRGDVAPFSTEIVTYSVIVDPFYQGTISNTAVITHPDLLNAVEVSTIAYVTSKPILQISKSASPDPVSRESALQYVITIRNLGQRATNLIITDQVPSNTEYIYGSGSAGIEVRDGQARWMIPVLDAGQSRSFKFQVSVGSGSNVNNSTYGVTCSEGVTAYGLPIITKVDEGAGGLEVFLPLVMK